MLCLRVRRPDLGPVRRDANFTQKQPMGISAHHSTPHAPPSLDMVGISASFACAVHCVVVALLLGVAPVSSLLAAAWIDWAFLGASVLIGLASLIPGYRTHQLRTPLVLFVSGVAMLVTLRAMHVGPSVFEVLVVILAATLLVTAHWKNRGALHRCACGPAHH